MRVDKVLATTAALVLLAGLVACAGGGEQEAAGGDEEWAWLQQTKEELDAKRTELADLRAELAALPPEPMEEADEPAEGEAAEGEAAEGAEEEPEMPERERFQERISQLESEIASMSEEFGGRLVTYINSLEIIRGEPLTERQKAAIRMKSDEDIEVAKEWIEKGGDYRRAIEIYEMQLQWDPENERLREALAEAQERRYMTEERFALAEKGMAQREIRDLLGPVNLHNIREFPERNVVAWFYPKENGDAAGVWFRLDDETGVYTVYQLDFEIETGDEGEEGGEEG